MKRFSKLAALLIGTAMIFAFAGCADSVTDTDKTDSVTNTDKTDSDYTLPAPANVKAAVSTKTVCAVTVTWDASNCDKYHKYCFYYSTKNDTSSLKKSNYECPSVWIKDGIGSYDVILSESGTYYFWVKATSGDNTISSDFSEASNPVAFTFALDAPTNVKAALSSEKLNTVTLTWNAINCDKNHCYWIYCSTKNDTSSLKEPKIGYCFSYNDGISSYDVSLSESGTYYFWVKAAPCGYYYTSTPSSAFSKVSNSVSFTYQDLPVPTDLQAYAEGNSIRLSWTSTKARYYQIYSNTENNSETATLLNGCCPSDNITIYDSWLTTGTTYYFWVKSADTPTADSPTSGFSNVASCTYGSE